jgi:hypothetical protein
MIYLRTVKFEHLLDEVGVPQWQQRLPTLAKMSPKAVWTVATPMKDGQALRSSSRLFKSLRLECNDAGKKTSLVNMLTGLHRALDHENYQEIIKDTSGLDIKVACDFEYRDGKWKVWELKYQKKDRLYFFTHAPLNPREPKLFIPMLFHHKKDQTTPVFVKDYCREVMKPFLDPAPKISLLKE